MSFEETMNQGETSNWYRVCFIMLITGFFLWVGAVLSMIVIAIVASTHDEMISSLAFYVGSGLLLVSVFGYMAPAFWRGLD